MSYEPFVGIWVKAEPKHITTFINNWEKLKKSQVFCVYDLPPILPPGGLIFLHAILENKILAWAKYVGYENVAGWYEHEVGITAGQVEQFFRLLDIRLKVTVEGIKSQKSS